MKRQFKIVKINSKYYLKYSYWFLPFWIFIDEMVGIQNYKNLEFDTIEEAEQYVEWFRKPIIKHKEEFIKNL